MFFRAINIITSLFLMLHATCKKYKIKLALDKGQCQMFYKRNTLAGPFIYYCDSQDMLSILSIGMDVTYEYTSELWQNTGFCTACSGFMVTLILVLFTFLVFKVPEINKEYN